MMFFLDARFDTSRSAKTDLVATAYSTNVTLRQWTSSRAVLTREQGGACALRASCRAPPAMRQQRRDAARRMRVDAREHGGEVARQSIGLTACFSHEATSV
jgi:hypothetical protein